MTKEKINNVLIKKNLKIVIWGFGKTGKSIFNYLKKYFDHEIYIVDKELNDNIKDIINNNFNFFFNEKDIDLIFNKIDYIFPSPGIIINKDNFKYYDKLISELDFFYQVWNKKIIAITGTVGKTSTTSLIYQLIGNLENALLGGNIGIPVFDLLEKKNYYDSSILEVSDAQLEHTYIFTADYIIFTNLYENHIDRHKNFINYVNSKLKLLKNDKDNRIKKILISDNAYNIIKNIINISFLKEKIIITFLNQDKIEFINGLKIENNKIIYFDKNNNLKEIILNNIPKKSHTSNWLLISGLLKSMNYNVDFIINTKNENLEIPEHRIEYVDTINSCLIYNDSKATIMESVEAAILQFRSINKDSRIILILGGTSKGVDRKPWILKFYKNFNIHKIIFFGKETEELSIFKKNNNLEIDLIYDLNEAVKKALSYSKNNQIILFSPGGASFDLFKSYEERGTIFKQIIKNEINN